MGKEVKILTSLVSDSRAGLRKANEGSFFVIFSGDRSVVQELSLLRFPCGGISSLKRLKEFCLHLKLNYGIK